MLEHTQVKDWMTSPAITISSATRISEAHQIMKDRAIRRLVVVNSENRLLGIVTIGDVREASPSDATSLSIWELNYLWAQLIVDRVMETKVLTVKPDDSILDAARIMLEHKISGLPVVDDTRSVLGVITSSDIFRMMIEEREAIFGSSS